MVVHHLVSYHTFFFLFSFFLFPFFFFSLTRLCMQQCGCGAHIEQTDAVPCHTMTRHDMTRHDEWLHTIVSLFFFCLPGCACSSVAVACTSSSLPLRLTVPQHDMLQHDTTGPCNMPQHTTYWVAMCHDLMPSSNTTMTHWA